MATKYLKGECQHCGGHLEYPAEAIGSVADCPHCQQPTELLLATPPQEPAVPRRLMVWAVIGVLILGGGLAGSLIALKRAQRWAARQKHAPGAIVPATNTPPEADGKAGLPEGLEVSSINIEKATDSSLRYAVGTLHNRSERQRFGVQTELDLLDDAGAKIGSAKDYRAVLEPGADWSFRALVLEPKAATARVAAVKEDQ